MSRARAFRRYLPVPAKRHRLPADARFAACRPRLTAAQGARQSSEPSRLALGAQPRSGCKSTAQSAHGLLIRLFKECAQEARRSTRGPCAAVRHGRSARRESARRLIPFRRHTEVPVEKPGAKGARKLLPQVQEQHRDRSSHSNAAVHPQGEAGMATCRRPAMSARQRVVECTCRMSLASSPESPHRSTSWATSAPSRASCRASS